MRAKSLTGQFGGRWHGSYGTARCPAHDDRRPSLSLKDGDSGRLLLFCHAGCSYQDIVAAIEAHAGALVLQTDAWERPEARLSCGRPISALVADGVNPGDARRALYSRAIHLRPDTFAIAIPSAPPTSGRSAVPRYGR